MDGADALEPVLRGELGDAAVARELAALLREDALAWRAPEAAPDGIGLIVAYTLGNLMLANGNREPGPVNEALADVAAALHGRTGARVFAQWEVAAAIGGRIAAVQLAAINPSRDALAEPVYLSTAGVAAAVRAIVGDPRACDRVAVVAFRDHAKRCIDVTRRACFDAWMPAGYAMPEAYDGKSGQPWTRSRVAYLLHDIRARITDRRDEILFHRERNKGTS